MGFKHDVVYFERAKRFAGETKYPFQKMLELAWNGITSFSVKPLQLITTLGIVLTVIFSLLLAVLGIAALCGKAVSGLLAATASIWLLGGILLISLGIVGSYMGKMYNEIKSRPRFAVEKTLMDE
jgi:hypothetical protein